jgi:hypothetical protein
MAEINVAQPGASQGSVTVDPWHACSAMHHNPTAARVQVDALIVVGYYRVITEIALTIWTR